MEHIVRCPFTPDHLEIPDVNFGSFFFDGITNYTTDSMVDAYSGVRVSRGDLLLKSEQLARNLLSLGCRQGDVVAIFSPNSIEWVLVVAALLRIDAIPAGINHLLTNHRSRASDVMHVIMELQLKNIQVIVNGSAALKGCILFDSLLSKLTESTGLSLPTPHDPKRPKLDDPCFIMFSSGTTGLQKAVLLSHRNLVFVCMLARHPDLDYVSGDTITFAPLAHIAGMLGIAMSLVKGSTTYLMAKFDFDVFLKILDKNSITDVFVVPPIATLLAKSPDVDKYRIKLKSLICGAAPLSQELEDQLRARFPGLHIRQFFGMTETSTAGSGSQLHTKFTAKSGSIGVPLYNTQMKVLDISTGQTLGPKQTGEICMKGPGIMIGYVNDEKATAATVDKNRWLRTGDLGYYDSDGYFYVVDRIKELIKYNAYQVAPAELEAVLLSHPGIFDAAVVGLPDADAGELPMAIVVRQSQSAITEEDVQKFVEANTAPYKRLRGGVRFVETIPKNASGKILRREIKKALLESKL